MQFRSPHPLEASGRDVYYIWLIAAIYLDIHSTPLIYFPCNRKDDLIGKPRPRSSFGRAVVTYGIHSGRA